MFTYRSLCRSVFEKKIFLYHHEVLVQLPTFDIVEDLVEFGALAITCMLLAISWNGSML